MPLNIYIGPWKISDSQFGIPGTKYYTPPIDSLGQNPVYVLDLRNIQKQAEMNCEDGLGFFVTIGTLPIDSYRYLGNYLTDNISPLVWEGLFGYTTEARTIGEALAEILTIRSDFDGVDGPKPLLPYLDKPLGKWVLGSPVAAVEPFNRILTKDGGSILQQEDFNRFVEQKRREYRELRTACLETGSNLYLKVLGGWGVQYGFTKPQDVFVPDDLPKESPAFPSTTLTDNFNRSNSTDWGSAWTRTTFDPNANANCGQILSNTIKIGGVGGGQYPSHYSRNIYHNTPFSSDNHYNQLTVNTWELAYNGGNPNIFTGVDVACRTDTNFGSSNQYGYFGRLWVRGNDGAGHTLYNIILYKIVNGSFTQLYTSGDINGGNPNSPYAPLKLDCNGSAIKHYWNSTLYGNVTDSAITGKYCVGIDGYDASAGDLTVDDFEASDGITVSSLLAKIDSILMKCYYKRTAPSV